MPEDIESFWEGLRPPRSPETQNPPTEGEIQAQQPRHIIRLGELEQRNQRLQELGREELNFLQHARDSGLFNGTLPTVINLLEGLVTLGCNRVNSFPSREDARKHRPRLLDSCPP